jgi:hypothetical protein
VVREEHHGAEQAEPEDGGRDRHEQVRRVVGRLGAYRHRHRLAPPAGLLGIAEEAGDEVRQVVGVPGKGHGQHEEPGQRAQEGEARPAVPEEQVRQEEQGDDGEQHRHDVAEIWW